MQVEWPLFGELCRALALKIFREYDPELVIGIAKAGAIPGAVVASILQKPFASITIARGDAGETMKLALATLRDLRPGAVKTAVSFRTGDYRPDFHALETKNFIILPWDREVIVDGEIVMRPDYAEKLRELGA